MVIQAVDAEDCAKVSLEKLEQGPEDRCITEPRGW
jgi:hypothetical protein